MTVFNELTWLIALPTLAAPIIYLVGRLVARRQGYTDRDNPARWLALIVLIIDLVPLYLAWQKLQGANSLPWQLGVVRMNLDGIGFLMAAVILGLGILATAFSAGYMRGEDGEEKFYALLTAMIAMMIGLCSAADLFNLWVWFEAMAVTSYMLVAFYREQPSSLEAGFKYLVQSATGSILILLGISLIFASKGTLDLAAMLATQAPLDYMTLAAGALFVIGFGVKVALVPMHTWLPDAHSQAPSGISAMLSGVVIETGLIALLRVLYPLSPAAGHQETWGMLLLGFAAINMLVGNLMALRQTQVKRMLAYSSVSHMGYMLVGIGVALTFSSTAGAEGAFFHLINHAAMKGLAFLAAGALLYGIHLSRGNHAPLVLDDLNGAARRYPLAAFAFSVAVLGLGGLPPLSGFMSKWQIFVAGFGTGNGWMIALVVFAALNSVLSLGYYAPMVNRLYRYEPSSQVTEGKPVSFWMSAPLVVLIVVVIVLGVWPALANGLTVPAAQSLLPFLLK
jgi:proton-translocating NADH-quinone oxidoreductase chain N